MGEANYGEPWVIIRTGNHRTDVWEGHGRAGMPDGALLLREVHDGMGDYADESNFPRIVACVNALSGIANVEALGALLKEVEAVLGYFGDDYEVVLAPLRTAKAALYAPQASEAPL